MRQCGLCGWRLTETQVKKKKTVAETRGAGGWGRTWGGGGGEGENRTIKTVTDKTRSTTIPKYRLQPASRGDSQHS